VKAPACDLLRKGGRTYSGGGGTYRKHSTRDVAQGCFTAAGNQYGGLAVVFATSQFTSQRVDGVSDESYVPQKHKFIVRLPDSFTFFMYLTFNGALMLNFMYRVKSCITKGVTIERYTL
jgi:hypothetical protein